VALSRTSLDISIQDSLSALDNPALMGDTVAYFNKDNFTNVSPTQENLPIPFIFGTASRFDLLLDSSTSFVGNRLDPNSMLQAICISYSSTIATNTNRQWGLCRISSAGVSNFGFTPSGINSSPTDYQILTGTSGQISKLKIGATFQDTAGGFHRVLGRSATTLTITKSTGFSGSVLTNSCPALVLVKDNENYYLKYGRDYTAAVTTTDGGNRFITCTLTNNFEANFSINPIDPSLDKLHYVVYPEFDSQKHGTVLELILTKMGLSIDVTSVSTANSSLPVNVNFSIPSVFESDFGKYYKYLGDLLSSTFGYIFLNNSEEIEYKLFESLSSGLVVTDTDILENTFSINLEYGDIVTGIVAYNPNCSNLEFTGASYTVKSDKAEKLHGINRVTKFIHVLEDISTRLGVILSVRSNRIATYTFQTKQVNYLSEIGDTVSLQKSNLLAQESTRNVIILGLNKSVNKTIIRALDLLNI
jgi:hypothetical protein